MSTSSLAEIASVIDNIMQTEIMPSPIHGFGLFSIQGFCVGTILTQLDGQKITWEQHEKNDKAFEWNALEGNVLLIRPHRTKYSYINHSREPNAKVVGSPLKVVAIKTIAKGEEITLDYRDEPLPQEYVASHGKSYL